MTKVVRSGGKLNLMIYLRVTTDEESNSWGCAGAASDSGDSDEKSSQPATLMVDELTDPYCTSDSESTEEEEETTGSYFCRARARSSLRRYRRFESSYLSSQQLPDSLTSEMSDFMMSAAIPANTGRIASPSVAGGGVKTRPTRP